MVGRAGGGRRAAAGGGRRTRGQRAAASNGAKHVLPCVLLMVLCVSLWFYNDVEAPMNRQIIVAPKKDNSDGLSSILRARPLSRRSLLKPAEVIREPLDTPLLLAGLRASACNPVDNP